MNNKSSGQKYASSLAGAKPDVDSHGLSILSDKAVAMEYYQKMVWKSHRGFGKPGKERRESGDGLRQKNALCEAYIKLIPTVIPIHSYGQCTQYAHLDDKVTFCGKTIESKGGNKKYAESACFQQLLKHVMNGGITQYK